MISRLAVRASVFALFIAVSSGTALADGKFFRSVQVADDPTIPSQRAAIFYRDGIETLIVESDIEHAGREMGWILPLPAPPTEIEACAPYTLSSLATQIQPRIRDEGGQMLLGSVLILALVCLYLATRLLEDRLTGRKISVIHVTLAVLVTILLVTALLPTLLRKGSLGGVAPNAVEVLATERVGVYDVNIVRAEDVSAITGWLDSNGFAWSPSSKSVLANYVREGWCFAASKVAADVEESATHHPLAFTFPADEAIYPMRLTGVGNESMTLDLFVIASKRADAAGLSAWYSDRFFPAEGEPSRGQFKLDSDLYAPEHHSFFKIGTPPIKERMWPGCVLTRLHGEFTQDAMSRDIQIGSTDGGVIRKEFYTHRAAHMISGSVAALCIAVVAGWFAVSRNALTWLKARLLVRGVPIALVPACVAYIGCYLNLDSVAIKRDESSDWRSFRPEALHEYTLIDLHGIAPEERTPDAYKRLIAAIPWEGDQPPRTDKLLEPGDFVIETVDDGWSLTILTRHYAPVTTVIPPANNPDDGSSP